jgi:putative ABC transport system substrate-binding protein
MARQKHAKKGIQRARAKKKVGFLNSASLKELDKPVAAFHRGMKELGFVEGQNVEITYQWAKHDLARLPDMARKLVDAGVDVIAATGGIVSAQAAVDAAGNGSAAKPARVVFVGAFNPDNLARSSGNATGVTTSTAESLPERLRLLEELVNHEKVVALLIRPNTVLAQREAKNGGGAPQLEARTEAELKQAFAEAKRLGYALLVGADAFFTSKRNRIVTLAEQFEVPTAYAFREFVDSGGLMSYGPSLANCYRQAGLYVGAILGDDKRGNLPILQSKHLELVINLKAARALHIDVPLELLARADHVIG